MSERSIDSIVAAREQLDEQLDRVERRITEEHPEVGADTVHDYVRVERERFADATVHVFLPILIERAVRERLAA
ncbi:MAG TPA: hypothetical protein VGD67_26405 [Pseudonocardiaceae bacterium]